MTRAFAKALGVDFAEHKVILGGSGEVPVSFTTRTDVARYLGHVLTTMQSHDILWRIFRIEGERIVMPFLRTNQLYLLTILLYLN